MKYEFKITVTGEDGSFTGNIQDSEGTQKTFVMNSFECAKHRAIGLALVQLSQLAVDYHAKKTMAPSTPCVDGA
jgi:hypothetical protein